MNSLFGTRQNTEEVDGSGTPLKDSASPVQQDMHQEEKTCRICLENDAVHDMIAPCRCSGSSKWVHRECLDMWRANEQDRAFSKCTECLFEYRLQATGSDRRRLFFILFCTRDVLFATLLLQLVIAALGALVWACDGHQVLVNALAGDCLADASPSSFWCNHVLSVYYMCGALTLLVLLGCFGSVLLCSHGCSVERVVSRLDPGQEGGGETNSSYHSEEHRANTYRERRRGIRGTRSGNDCDNCCYCCCCDDSSSRRRGYYSGGGPYYGPNIWYCPGGDADCCSCDCCPDNTGDNLNGNDSAHIVLLILVVVLVILAIVGFVVGVVLAVFFVQRVVQRHFFLLQKRRLVEEFRVVDLERYGQGGEEQRYTSSAEIDCLVQPSAPPAELDDSDKTRLQKLGLMDKPSGQE